jgi:hypothetical protein
MENTIEQMRSVAIQENLESVLFSKFMAQAFSNPIDMAYVMEWVRRFKTGNPRAYMDLERRKIFDSVIQGDAE